MARTRTAHYIGLNHQNRVPKRWISFDTESRKRTVKGGEVQTWDLGCARRWTYDHWGYTSTDEGKFSNPEDMWAWVDEFSRKQQRTVITAHNLGHDIRISRAMGILPELGWRLEWCNLDRNVSSMTWRSDHGTLVFSDLFTWLPMPLADIGKLVELDKLTMPSATRELHEWYRYCMRDAEIVELAVREIVDFIKVQDLGNWQPTGAGMAYATWRHKFMTHRVLVHDELDALKAERDAMHTGRAEAWIHGKHDDTTYSEVDMRNAYTVIARDCDLPVKLKFHNGPITKGQFDELSQRYRVLSLCRVQSEAPIVPTHHGGRIIWPVGQFDTWLWDPEVRELYGDGAQVQILECYAYTRAPVLRNWAEWVLRIAHGDESVRTMVVGKWAKHCGRALIGRLSLRAPEWMLFADNPDGMSGISHTVDMATGEVHRQLHIGNQTFQETGKQEGKDSLPQITGYIMSECRVRLWQAMKMAGLENVVHVDTDGLVLTARGVVRLAEGLGPAFKREWQIKGSCGVVTVYGPRNYRMGEVRKTAGIPRKAIEVSPGVYEGESWASMATDMATGDMGIVSVGKRKWVVTNVDPRRLNAPGTGGRTVAVRLGGQPSSASPSESNEMTGLYLTSCAE